MKLTAKQEDAMDILSSVALHIMLYGGSRSGKTFLLVRSVIMRAVKAPGSRHAILRFRFNHVKTSIIMDTYPKVMALCFPGIQAPVNKTDFFATFPNGSEIWFGGLDDKERTEKILGNEYATIYLNECSQISNSAREIVVTRLAQKVDQEIGGIRGQLEPRMYYDCNPPSKSHWTYKLFYKKQDPESKRGVKDPGKYNFIQMNPLDNKDNLSDNYISTLEELSPTKKKRFLDGEFSDDNPNALFSDMNFATYRTDECDVPDLIRIVVAVDPSGSGDEDNALNDEIGIVAVGLGVDGNAYVLKDNTLKGSPGKWGAAAVHTLDSLDGDIIVGEKNFGGDMVRHCIQTIDDTRHIPFKAVHASRGKVVRAEPVSALYEQGKVRHVGDYPDLEDELIGFSTMGYLGERSPNRSDALVWAIVELFPRIVRPKKEEPKEEKNPHSHRGHSNANFFTPTNKR